MPVDESSLLSARRLHIKRTRGMSACGQLGSEIAAICEHNLRRTEFKIRMIYVIVFIVGLNWTCEYVRGCDLFFSGVLFCPVKFMKVTHERSSSPSQK